MNEDPWQDEDVKAFIHDVLVNMAPKLKAASAALSLVPDGQGDVKYWMELGASIMMDKPLIVVVLGDRVLPPKLALVADEVVRVNSLDELVDNEALTEVLKRINAR